MLNINNKHFHLSPATKPILCTVTTSSRAKTSNETTAAIGYTTSLLGRGGRPAHPPTSTLPDYSQSY